MLDLEGNIITTKLDLADYLEIKRLMPGYRKPAADLGYCLCGTVWNIEALADQNFKRGMCPDCGEDAAAIEFRSTPPRGRRLKEVAHSQPSKEKADE